MGFGALRCSRLDSLLVYSALALCLPQVLRLLQDPSNADELQVGAQMRAGLCPQLGYSMLPQMQEVHKCCTHLVQIHCQLASQQPSRPMLLGDEASRRAILHTFVAAVSLLKARSPQEVAACALQHGVAVELLPAARKPKNKSKHKHKHKRRRRDRHSSPSDAVDGGSEDMNSDAEFGQFEARLTAGSSSSCVICQGNSSLKGHIVSMFSTQLSCLPLLAAGRERDMQL